MAMEKAASSQRPEAFEPVHIAIATVGRPIGLDGWCRIFPHGNTLLATSIPLQVKAGPEKPEITLTLRELSKDGKGYRGRFEGYANWERVDTVKNYQLFMPKENLPDNQPDEYYHFELEGMAVYRKGENEPIGTVINVHNYPTVDALEVAMKKGNRCIVPMTKDTVKKIDKESRAVIIDDAALEELL